MSQDNVKKNQTTVWIIFIVGLIPVVMAFGAYFLKIGIPESTSNHGILIGKGTHIKTLLPELSSELDDQHFHLISFSDKCQASCVERLKLLKNIHWGTGRFTPKIRRWHITNQVSLEQVSLEIPDQRVRQLSIPKGLGSLLVDQSWTDEWVLLVDPYGFLVMAFNPSLHGKGMIDDLKKIIRMSELG